MDPAAELARSLRSWVGDARVLDAVAHVPRDRFVPPRLRERAWENEALPIGRGQTISQPLVVARMLEVLRLRPEDRVLDVGTGSGYHAALLAQLARHVWTIERLPQLSAWAAGNLAEARVENVTAIAGDGSRGLPEEAPFDAIVVTAAAPALVDALTEQLAPGGTLVAPVGAATGQSLLRLRKDAAGRVSREDLGPVVFVPLLSGLVD